MPSYQYKDRARVLLKELREDRRISTVEVAVLSAGMDTPTIYLHITPEDISNLSDLFDALGGPAVVGRAIGKGTEHAHSMKTRGSVPILYWPALIQACREAGLEMDADKLLAIHLSPASEVDTEQAPASASTPGRRLAQLREAAGLTQQAVADAVGAHLLTMSKLERGKMKLTYEWATKLAKPLGVKAADLFDVSDGAA